MPSVAVATDSTQLPAARARGRAKGSIRSACTSAGRANPSASWRWTASTLSTSGCAAIPSCPRPPSPRSATSSPSGSRSCEAGQDIVSIHLAGGISGTCEAARQAHGLLSRARPRRSRRGDRRRNRLRRDWACWCSPPAPPSREGADMQGVAARVREARKALRIWFCLDTLEYLRRGGRVGKAQAWLGRHAEDQADPLARVRDHPGRARAHRRARVRAHGPVRAGTPRLRRRRLGRAAHPGARAGPAPDRPLPRDLRLRAGLHLRGRTGDRHLHRARA